MEHSWRSGLERTVGDGLRELGVKYEYESEKLKYTLPEESHTYTPDFKVDGLYIETKGKFTAVDRKKMKHVFLSNPGLKLVMAFPKPNNKLRKGSKTTYAMWCNKNGIPWISVDDLLNHYKKGKAYHADLLQRRA